MADVLKLKISILKYLSNELQDDDKLDYIKQNIDNIKFIYEMKSDANYANIHKDLDKLIELKSKSTPPALKSISNVSKPTPPALKSTAPALQTSELQTSDSIKQEQDFIIQQKKQELYQSQSYETYAEYLNNLKTLTSDIIGVIEYYEENHLYDQQLNGKQLRYNLYKLYKPLNIFFNALTIYEIDSIDRLMSNMKDFGDKGYINLSCGANKTFIGNFYSLFSGNECSKTNITNDKLEPTSLLENYVSYTAPYIHHPECLLPHNYTSISSFNQEDQVQITQSVRNFSPNHFITYTIKKPPKLSHLNPLLCVYFQNNMTFIKSLDILLYNSATWEQHNIRRSTHLFKGLKNYLLNGKLVDGIIQNGTVIKLGYYNSTSSDIYKGCLYAHDSNYETDNKVMGHLLVITPINTTQCVDYISLIRQHHGVLPPNYFAESQEFIPEQFSPNKKYVYEQEVLFKRYSEFTKTKYQGQIKYVQINGTYYSSNGTVVDNSSINTNEIILDNKGQLFLDGIICQTHQLEFIRGIFKFSNGIENTTDDYIPTNHLDILIDSAGNLDITRLTKFIGTHVYTCNLVDAEPLIIPIDNYIINTKQIHKAKTDYVREMAGGNINEKELTYNYQMSSNTSEKELTYNHKISGGNRNDIIQDKNSIILHECNDDRFVDSHNNIIDQIILNIEVIDTPELINVNSNNIYILLKDYTLNNKYYKHINKIKNDVFTFNLYYNYIKSLGIYIYFMIIHIDLNDINQQIIDNIKDILNQLYNTYFINNILFYNIYDKIYHINNNKLYDVLQMQNKNKYFYLIQVNYEQSIINKKIKFNYNYLLNKYDNRQNIVKRNKDDLINQILLFFKNLIKKINIKVEINCENNYYQKYLKYKIKYLELKNK
jgi:hypothetical protein